MINNNRLFSKIFQPNHYLLAFKKNPICSCFDLQTRINYDEGQKEFYYSIVDERQMLEPIINHKNEIKISFKDCEIDFDNLNDFWYQLIICQKIQNEGRISSMFYSNKRVFVFHIPKIQNPHIQNRQLTNSQRDNTIEAQDNQDNIQLFQQSLGQSSINEMNTGFLSQNNQNYQNNNDNSPKIITELVKQKKQNKDQQQPRDVMSQCQPPDQEEYDETLGLIIPRNNNNNQFNIPQYEEIKYKDFLSNQQEINDFKVKIKQIDCLCQEPIYKGWQIHIEEKYKYGKAYDFSSNINIRQLILIEILVLTKQQELRKIKYSSEKEFIHELQEIMIFFLKIGNENQFQEIFNQSKQIFKIQTQINFNETKLLKMQLFNSIRYNFQFNVKINIDQIENEKDILNNIQMDTIRNILQQENDYQYLDSNSIKYEQFNHPKYLKLLFGDNHLYYLLPELKEYWKYSLTERKPIDEKLRMLFTKNIDSDDNAYTINQIIESFKQHQIQKPNQQPNQQPNQYPNQKLNQQPTQQPNQKTITQSSTERTQYSTQNKKKGKTEK